MLTVVGAALVVYLGWLGVLLAVQRNLLFPREHAVPDARAAQRHPGTEKLVLQTEAGPVEAWLMPAKGAERPGAAVIFAHGNAETADNWLDGLAAYRELGVTVLVPEYRGYARSAGTPSQRAIVEDFVRFHDLLAARPEVDPKRIVLHGRSLGGGVACAVALRRRPAALVLQSTFRSVGSLARGLLAPEFLARDPFDNEAALEKLDVPMLLGHGRRDELIPFADAQALQRAARGRAELVEWDAGHNDAPPDERAWMRRIEQFLRANAVLR